MSVIFIPRRQNTGLQALGQSVGELFATINQIKEMQGQRMINDATMKAIAAGGGIPEIVDAITAVKTGQPQFNSPATRAALGGMMGTAQAGMLNQTPQQESVASKIFGYFNLDKPSFNRITDTENLITQLGIRRAMEPKQTENYGAVPWYNSPQWKNTPEGKAAAAKALEQDKVKPLNMVDINRDSEMMDSVIETAKDPKWWWRKDYTQENLKSAWNNYKSVRNFDSLPILQKQQLVNLWNAKLANKMKKTEGIFDDSEVDWDPSMLNNEFEISDLKSQSNQQTEGGSIRVKAPNGTVGTIPAEDWEEAQKQGYVRVQ